MPREYKHKNQLTFDGNESTAPTRTSVFQKKNRCQNGLAFFGLSGTSGAFISVIPT